MSSFSELKVNKFMKSGHGSGLVIYNTKQLSRIYPKGSRVNSSNYDPVPGWTCGSQMVALNYQTGSLPMWINLGKFQDNGGCGYVLKPKFLLDPNEKFDPEVKVPVKQTLYIQILSGWQFPKSERHPDSKKGDVIDPYIWVQMTGTHQDHDEFKTKVVKNNGFNPIFKAEKKFAISNPDLAYLTFCVYDYDVATADAFIGQYSLPVTCIRPGIRSVPLKDSHGKTYENSSLLVIFKYL